MMKYELLPEQLLHEGTVSEDQFFAPSLLSEGDILRTHTADYWHQLQHLPLDRKMERAIGFPVRDDLVHRGRYIAHGTLECALHAIEHGLAYNIAGGTHHAFADHGEGFCVFNDIAVAAHCLLERDDLRHHAIDKILIIDLDVHQGNGTAHIFKNDDRVYTWSMHGAKNYPVRKQKSDLDIGLADGCTDDTYLRILADHLEPTIDLVRPDMIFYLSGVDVLATDKLGRLGMSLRGTRQRDDMILAACHRHEIPVTVSMGGGYSEQLRDIIEAHAGTYRSGMALYG